MGNISSFYFGEETTHKYPHSATSNNWSTIDQHTTSRESDSKFSYAGRWTTINDPSTAYLSPSHAYQPAPIRSDTTSYRNAVARTKHIGTRSSSSTNPLRIAVPILSSNITTMTDYISEYAADLYWSKDWNVSPSVRFINLNEYSSEYQDVRQTFNNSNKKCFRVKQITRVQNPYLLAAFLLKQEQMWMTNENVEIEELFHGTKLDQAGKICRDNFDWRLYGQNVGNIFGQGISFTPFSNYATHYGSDDRCAGVMILAHVLIGSECVGSKQMILPPAGYDTTIKPTREVIVKYEDNEFYPAYIIHYVCTSSEEIEIRRLKKAQKKNFKHPNKHRGGHTSAMY